MSDPRAGQPAQPVRPRRRGPPRDGLLHGRAGPRRPGPAGRLRDVGAPRLEPPRVVQRGPHPRHDAGDLRVPGRPGHRRAAVHRARHPRPVRAGVGRARSRCSPPTTSPCSSTPPTATRRRRPCRTPSCAPTAGGRPDPGSPTASSSRRRTTRPPTAASSTTRPTAGRPTPTPPAGSPGGPTSCSPPGWRGVDRVPFAAARAAAGAYDFLGTYVDDLPNVLDLDAVRDAGVRIGADPLGGASVDYWAAIAERHRLDLTVVNPLVDPTWRFMTLDWDGKIRMDCSSPDAMASLIDKRADVRHRHRQRRRQRPPRHRHARRPDEPEPLPRRRHRLPLRRPRRLAAPMRRSARRSCRRR